MCLGASRTPLPGIGHSYHSPLHPPSPQSAVIICIQDFGREPCTLSRPCVLQTQILLFPVTGVWIINAYLWMGANNYNLIGKLCGKTERTLKRWDRIDAYVGKWENRCETLEFPAHNGFSLLPFSFSSFPSRRL